MAEANAAPRASRTVVLAGAGLAATLDRFDALVDELQRRGHRVAIAAAVVDDAGRAGADARGVLFAEVPHLAGHPRTMGDRATARTLAAHLRTWHAHAILGWGGKPALVAALAGPRAGLARTVLVTSGLPEAVGEKPGLAWRWLLYPAVAAATAVATTSDEERAFLRSAGLTRARQRLIALPPASVALDRHRPLPLPVAGPVTILALCGNAVSDGAGVLAAALTRVKGDRPRVLLAGPFIPDPEGLSEAALAEAGLQFPTDEHASAALLSRAHVVLDPSPLSGNPVGLSRALAHGRPVIATDVPGNRDAVDSKVSGVLVAPQDPGALATAIEGIMRHPDLLPSMARAARGKAERVFDSRSVDGRLLAELDVS